MLSQIWPLTPPVRYCLLRRLLRLTRTAPFRVSCITPDTTNKCNQDGPSVRPAVHQGGTVYVAFYRWTGSTCSTADIIVVRDDNWGTGPNPFQALQDSGTHTIGQRAAQGIALGTGSLGNQRIGSQMAIAVDPTNSQTVYVASGHGSPYTPHVRRSTHNGQ